MNEQPETNHPGRGIHRYQYVCQHGPLRVQRVRTYAAAVRVIQRIGQQMVQIDHHRCQHDQPRPLPEFRKYRTGGDPGHQDMERQVNGRAYEKVLQKKGALGTHEAGGFVDDV